MTYERDAFVNCGGCDGEELMLNQVGMCAACMAKLTPQEIVNLDVVEPVVEEHTHYTTISRQSTGLRAMLFGAMVMGAIAGAASAVGIIYLLMEAHQ